MLNLLANRTIIAFMFATMGLVLGVQNSHGQSAVEKGKIYWTNRVFGKQVQRADLDGSNIEDLVTTATGVPEGIALDLTEGKMYWTDSRDGKIKRANLGGSNVENLITEGLELPHGIALDVDGGKMYWTNRNAHTIQRANLDGSDVEDLITEGVKTPQGIALDVGAGKIYWTQWGEFAIRQANLDGSNIENLIPSEVGFPQGIALDVEAGKMYYLIPPEIGAPLSGIALDPTKGRIYWADRSEKAILRADLNGSNVKNLFTRASPPLFITLDSVGGKMYWAVYSQVDVGRDASAIYRADLDGSNVEGVVGAKAGSREFILDVDGGKIYWDYEDVPPTWYPEAPNFILRADLDGSNVEDLVLVLMESGIPRLLDVGGGKVYWSKTDWTHKTTIQRADLDGSNAEILLTGTDAQEFALDLGRGKMYWTSGGKIQRANLDGSNVEVLFREIGINIQNLVLDAVGGKIYWTDWSTSGGTIQRANLDGSDIEVLFREIGINIQNLVLDAVGGKIYWTDWGTDYWSPGGTIQRANLDGSNVEILVTGLFSPSIALAIPRPVPTLVSTHSSVPPTTSRLEPNYPNPFNSTTQISYRLATPGPVRLDVYNILGQQVHTLVDQAQAAGFYQVPWNARDQRGAAVATGVYLMRLHYPGGVQTRRLLLLK